MEAIISLPNLLALKAILFFLKFWIESILFSKLSRDKMFAWLLLIPEELTFKKFVFDKDEDKQVSNPNFFEFLELFDRIEVKEVLLPQDNFLCFFLLEVAYNIELILLLILS